MKKEDLKTGMYVKTENEEVWIIVEFDGEPFMTNPSGWMDIESFPKSSYANSDYDIIEVYAFIGGNKAAGFQYDIFKDLFHDSSLFNQIYPPRETISIGDIKYDKQEFEEAVKNLKPIE